MINVLWRYRVNNLDSVFHHRAAIQYKRPARWVPGHGGYLPRRAVSGGEGENGTVYVGMAEHEGHQVLGMVVPGEGVCYVPWEGEAIAVSQYYVSGNFFMVTYYLNKNCMVGSVHGSIVSKCRRVIISEQIYL